jgi:energy-converting hydrogenase Eha subunit C
VNFLRAAVRQVVGLFVSDWVQGGVVLAIIAAGWLAVSRLGTPAVVVFVLLIAAQLVWFARAEGVRRSRRQSPS